MKKTFHFFLLLLFSFQVKAQNAEVLRYTKSITIQNQKLTTSTKLYIKINNPKGNKYGEFTFPFSKKNKLKISGRITDAEGNVIQKLSKKAIAESSYFDYASFYNDNFQKTFWLQHNNYPYIVECEYIYETDQFLHIVDWTPMVFPELSTKEAVLELVYPKDFQFNLYSNNMDSPVTSTNTKGEIIQTWSSSFTGIEVFENFMPDIQSQVPKVSISPLHFHYAIPGSFKSWSSFGNYMTQLTEGRDYLTYNEQQVINKITQGLETPNDIVKALYYYLQENTHYVNVNIEFGGLQPYSAEYVCTNKYGDCKALTNYMRAMLKYKKIESYFALVHAGEKIKKIIPDFPAQQFNHVILCVPIESDTMWLECTANHMKAGYLGSFTQGRKALIINGFKSHLVNLPQLCPEDITSSAMYTFQTANGKSINAEVNYHLTGEEYNSVKSALNHLSKKEFTQYIENNIELHNVSVDNYTIKEFPKDSAMIQISADFSSSNPQTNIGRFTKFSHPKLQLPTFQKPEERYSEVQIDYPIIAYDTLIYKGNYDDLNHMISTVKDTSNFGDYFINRKLDKELLTVIRGFQIKRQNITMYDYESFFNFYQELITNLSTTILTKKTK